MGRLNRLLGAYGCEHAPILEEDIAFANIALDELGHALLWYGAYAKKTNGNPEIIPDRLVYQRKAAEFRCSQFVELANQDWAFTIVRQYLFDMPESLRLVELQSRPNEFIAEIAVKILPEEYYHRRHSEAWMKRLGVGTEESNQCSGP